MADNTARKWCSQLQEGVSGAEKNVEDTKHTLYDEWIQGVPYYENDYVLHNGKLYICVTTTDSEPGTTVDWIEVNVAEELSHLHTEVTALNSKLEWKLLGSATGSTQINFGNKTINELTVVVENGNARYSINVPYVALLDVWREYKAGSTSTSQYTNGVAVQISKTYAKLSWFYIGGNTVTGDCTTYVYYR